MVGPSVCRSWPSRNSRNSSSSIVVLGSGSWSWSGSFFCASFEPRNFWELCPSQAFLRVSFSVPLLILFSCWRLLWRPFLRLWDCMITFPLSRDGKWHVELGVRGFRHPSFYLLARGSDLEVIFSGYSASFQLTSVAQLGLVCGAGVRPLAPFLLLVGILSFSVPVRRLS